MEYSWYFEIVIIAIMAAVIYGMSFFVEFLFVKRIMDDPAKGMITSVVIAYLIDLVLGLLYSEFSAAYVVRLTIALFIVLALHYPAFRRLKKRAEVPDEIFE